MLEVNIISGFSTCPPDKHGVRQIQNWKPAPVRELLLILGIDEREIGLISVNGKKAGPDDVIPDQAIVTILPYFFGG